MKLLELVMIVKNSGETLRSCLKINKFNSLIKKAKTFFKGGENDKVGADLFDIGLMLSLREFHS